jgi:hypothetical protein
MTTCASSTCEREAIMAITSRAPKNKDGLVTTIYQFAEDAPKNAPWYCGPCGVDLAANLAALTDGDLRVQVTVTGGAEER